MRTLIATLVAFATLSTVAWADGVAPATMILPGAGIVHVRTTSLADERFANIVRQSVDYSCGAAAVATILRYAFGLPETENSIIRGLLTVSDLESVKKRGFSLLDIKRFLNTIGYGGAGYKLPLEDLYRVKVPTIVLVTIEGYEHFVVLKKATPEYVYVADPMLGNRRVDTSDFLNTWNGVVFVIASSAYDSSNPLLALNQPLPLSVMNNSIPSAWIALDNAELMSLYIPAMNRI